MIAICLGGLLHFWTPYAVIRKYLEHLYLNKSPLIGYALFLSIFALILLLRPGGVAPYLYFRF